MAAVILQRQPPAAAGGADFAGLFAQMLDELRAQRELLDGLYTLGRPLRADRSTNSELARVYLSATIAGAVVRMADLRPDTQTENYTTLHCTFAATSGAGRYLDNGQSPTTGGLVGSGKVIPAGFSTLAIVGRQNISNFQIIAEAAGTPVLLDAMLYM